MTPAHDPPLRLLCVADDASLLDLHAEFLPLCIDARIVTETDAEAALDLLDVVPFDCIVSDTRLRGLDGLDFLAAIRQDLGRTTPVIIFTADTRDAVAMDALDRGADRVIQRGGDVTTQCEFLAAAIEQVTAAHRTAQRAGECEALLDWAATVATFGTIEWDLRDYSVDCSPQLHRLLDLPVGVALTMADIVRTVHPTDRAAFEAALAAAIEGETQCDHTTRHVLADGEVIWTRTQTALVRNDIGDPVRLVGICADVTARRRLAETDVMADGPGSETVN